MIIKNIFCNNNQNRKFENIQTVKLKKKKKGARAYFLAL